MTFKIMLKSFFVNLFLAIIKIIVSLLTNSKTLLADAVHGLSDFSTDIVALTGSKIAAKKPDKTHPYGHGKMEYVTSIFISLFVISLGVMIFLNSFSIRKINYSFYVFILIIASLVLKILISNYLLKNGKKINSNILISSGYESRFDAVNTTFALFIVIISYFQKYIYVLRYADMIGSIVISILTLKVGLKIFTENIKSVLGEKDIDPEKNEIIKNIILNYDKVLEIKNITLLKYGSYMSMNLEIIMDKNIKLKNIYRIKEKIIKKIKKEFNDIKYIFIDVKPNK